MATSTPPSLLADPPTVIFLVTATDAVAEVLCRRFPVRTEAARTSQRTYYDTFDWRLYRAGLTLKSLGRGRARRLTLRSAAGEGPLEARAARPPGFAADLPPGVLREALAPVVEMRRLLPVVEVAIAGEGVRILDKREKTVARVALERGVATDPGARQTPHPMAPVVRVAGVRGYQPELGEVVAFLEAEVGAPPAETSELHRALAALHRQPGDYTSKLDVALEPHLRADSAVHRLLRALLATLRRNEAGIRNDLDSEFLHDHRVAARRCRSLLGQVKGVLPAAKVEALRVELGWLGGITGPLRDLDVALLKMEGYRTALPEAVAADLAPLEGLLRRRRRQARKRLLAALRAPRYGALVAAWQGLAEGVTTEDVGAEEAARPIGVVASDHIWRAYRRVWRRGRRIDATTPAAALHRLRIQCKKLRYLMEAFRRLYDAGEIGPLIRTLKQLQDHLGDFNDLKVQQAHLKAMAEALAREGAPAATLMAVGRLVAHLEVQQQAERRRFAKAFRRFATADHRATFHHLFQTSGVAVL